MMMIYLALQLATPFFKGAARCPPYSARWKRCVFFPYLVCGQLTFPETCAIWRRAGDETWQMLVTMLSARPGGTWPLQRDVRSGRGAERRGPRPGRAGGRPSRRSGEKRRATPPRQSCSWLTAQTLEGPACERGGEMRPASILSTPLQPCSGLASPSLRETPPGCLLAGSVAPPMDTASSSRPAPASQRRGELC